MTIDRRESVESERSSVIGDGSDRALGAAQQGMAETLARLGATLQRQQGVDAVLAMDTVVEALAAIDRWLDPGTGLMAIEMAGREHIARWEDRIIEAYAYLGALRKALRETACLAPADYGQQPVLSAP